MLLLVLAAPPPALPSGRPAPCPPPAGVFLEPRTEVTMARVAPAEVKGVTTIFKLRLFSLSYSLVSSYDSSFVSGFGSWAKEVTLRIECS